MGWKPTENLEQGHVPRQFQLLNTESPVTRAVGSSVLAFVGGDDLTDDDPDAHEKCAQHCVKPLK